MGIIDLTHICIVYIQCTEGKCLSVQDSISSMGQRDQDHLQTYDQGHLQTYDFHSSAVRSRIYYVKISCVSHNELQRSKPLKPEPWYVGGLGV